VAELSVASQHNTWRPGFAQSIRAATGVTSGDAQCLLTGGINVRKEMSCRDCFSSLSIAWPWLLCSPWLLLRCAGVVQGMLQPLVKVLVRLRLGLVLLLLQSQVNPSSSSYSQSVLQVVVLGDGKPSSLVRSL